MQKRIALIWSKTWTLWEMSFHWKNCCIVISNQKVSQILHQLLLLKSKTKLNIFSNISRFDANKSTKGASKLRRDLINAEIANLRDLLPLPQSTRQRLSQLQLMALVCVYVRKANYFQQGMSSEEWKELSWTECTWICKYVVDGA